MKIYILTLFAVLAVCPAWANAQEKDHKKAGNDPKTSDLADILRVVLANNPELQAARAQWQAAKERVPQSAAWEDPKVSAMQLAKRFTSTQPNSFTDSSVTLEQTIPISGKNKSRERGAKAQALGAYETFRRAQLDIVLRTKKAYYNLETAAEELEINARNDDLLKQFSEISRAKYEVGNRSQADVLMAESELAKNSEACMDLKREYSDAQSELNLLMNRPPQTPLERPAQGASMPTAGWTLEEAGRRALASQPELRMAQAKVDEQRAVLQLAQREWIPDPALSVTANRYNETSQGVSEVDAGISFNLPWVNEKKYSAEIREARAMLENAQHTLDAQQEATLRAVRDQLTKIETFHHHYMLYSEKIVPLAEQTIKSLQSAYESDKSSFLELTSAQHSLTEVQHEEVAHLREYKIAIAELDALVGDDLPAPNHH